MCVCVCGCVRHTLYVIVLVSIVMSFIIILTRVDAMSLHEVGLAFAQ